MQGELELNGHCSVSFQQHQGAPIQVKHHISTYPQTLHAGNPDTTENFLILALLNRINFGGTTKLLIL